MLPIDTLIAAMDIEAGLPPRPYRATSRTSYFRSIRRLVGRGLVAVGLAVGGTGGGARGLSAAR